MDNDVPCSLPLRDVPTPKTSSKIPIITDLSRCENTIYTIYRINIRKIFQFSKSFLKNFPNKLSFNDSSLSKQSLSNCSFSS